MPDGARIWNGPYLSRADGIMDPWGKAYVYKRAAGAKDYKAYSMGADVMGKSLK